MQKARAEDASGQEAGSGQSVIIHSRYTMSTEYRTRSRLALYTQYIPVQLNPGEKEAAPFTPWRAVQAFLFCASTSRA